MVHMVKPHVLLGIFIVLLVICQATFGYHHHKAFKLMKKVPLVTLSHVLLGRVIVLLGCANVWT